MQLLTGQEVKLAHLEPQGHPGILRGWRFEDCDIVGPAIVGVMGTTFSNCLFLHDDPDLSDIIWPIPLERQNVIGTIPLIECTFIKCRFRMIGFALPPDMESHFRSMLRPEGGTPTDWPPAQ